MENVENPSEPIVEAKEAPKKRGRKPKAAAVVVEVVPLEQPVEEQQPEVQVDAHVSEDINVNMVDVTVEEPLQDAKSKTKPKRAPRSTKPKVNNEMLEAEQLEARELTAEEQQQLILDIMRKQQLNKRAVKQEKYKKLLSSAF